MDPAPTARSVCRLGLRIGPFAATGQGWSLLDRATAVARSAEEAGFDSLWLADGNGDTPRSRWPAVRSGAATGYEEYSLLGALAIRTGTLRLGVLPEGRDRRQPAVTAKIVTTVDVLSDGRGCLTLGTTGPDEAEADGLDVDGRALAERLQVCRTVLEDEEPEFAGSTYAVHGAFNRPRPVQPGGIPIVVATRAGQPVSEGVLRAAVDHADAIVMDGDGAAVEAMCRTAATRRAASGRPPVAVLWTATAPDDASTLSALTEQVRTRLEAGAAGCIVELVDPGGGALNQVGPVLRQVVDSVLGPEPAGWA